MQYTQALEIAQEVEKELSPYCDRIIIAGSIRRSVLFVKDIEIVAIPKHYETGLFESGIAKVVNKWEKIRGDLPCKYTQRRLPQGIKLDLFFAVPENWGYILAIRTGSKDWVAGTLATCWVRKGYKGVDGFLTYQGERIQVREESDLFRILGLPYVAPNRRKTTYKPRK